MVTALHCPACGQSDQIAKVSLLYMHGLELKKLKAAEGEAGTGKAPVLPEVFAQMDASTWQALSSRLKPPASGKELPIRPVNPDLVVLVFSLAVPFFFYQIWTSQAGTILPMAIILAGFYGFYLWQRPKILVKYKRQVEDRRHAVRQVTSGVERWMRLYYCAREEVVFAPGAKQVIPADELLDYLMRNDGK